MCSGVSSLRSKGFHATQAMEYLTEDPPSRQGIPETFNSALLAAKGPSKIEQPFCGMSWSLCNLRSGVPKKYIGTPDRRLEPVLKLSPSVTNFKRLLRQKLLNDCFI